MLLVFSVADDVCIFQHNKNHAMLGSNKEHCRIAQQLAILSSLYQDSVTVTSELKSQKPDNHCWTMTTKSQIQLQFHTVPTTAAKSSNTAKQCFNWQKCKDKCLSATVMHDSNHYHCNCNKNNDSSWQNSKSCISCLLNNT